MRKLFFLPLFLLSSICEAQVDQSKIDSIRSVLNTIEDPTSRFAECKVLVKQEQNRNNRLAILHLLDPEDFKIADTTKISHLYQIAEGHLVLNNLDSFTFYNEKVYALSEEVDSFKYKVAALNANAHYMAVLGKHDSSIYYYKNALETLDEIVPNETMSLERKMMTKADVLGNASGVFFNIQDFVSAKKYLSESQEICEEYDFVESSVYNLIRLSLIEKQEGNLTEALIHNFDAVEKLKIVKDSSLLLYNYDNIGQIYLLQENLDQAIYYLNKSEELALEIADIPNYLNVLNSQIKIYLKQGKNKKAEQTAFQLLNESEKAGNSRHKKSALNRLYDVSLAQKDIAAALDFRNQYYSLKDSTEGHETREKIAEIQTEYETEKKEAEIERLSLENSLKDSNLARSRNAQYALATGGGFFIILLVVFFTLRSKKQKAEQEAQELQIEALQKRLFDMNLNPYEKQFDLLRLNEILNSPLTEREFETLDLSLQEKSNSQIAEQLFISKSTVKFHLRNTYKKLGVGNRREALAYLNKTS
ncbi:MAG: LuxR C-terminal-related transcriptional regulator [Cyclobacteriaceae bacterium]